EMRPPRPASVLPNGDVKGDGSGDAVATKAEGGLSSEAGSLKEQARNSQPLDDRENLLRGNANDRPSA
ncbi:MAG TPA: hypothetical protein VGE52_13865, partial [Pirellulales bacterium]